MKLEKRSDGWWIVEIPDTVTEAGPYDKKIEAEEDQQGLARAFKSLDDGTFGDWA
jgi:hypothetical protein